MICKNCGIEISDDSKFCVGCGIAIEKGFQCGSDKVREQGVRVESLAVIESMSDDSVTFRR